MSILGPGSPLALREYTAASTRILHGCMPQLQSLSLACALLAARRYANLCIGYSFVHSSLTYFFPSASLIRLFIAVISLVLHRP
jgi:hypothetical protein